MIIINKGLKNGSKVNEINFPHLFALDENHDYCQYRDFHWEYDTNYNIIIETTIKNIETLKEKIETALKYRKKIILKIINEENKELNAINEILEEK